MRGMNLEDARARAQRVLIGKRQAWIGNHVDGEAAKDTRDFVDCLLVDLAHGALLKNEPWVPDQIEKAYALWKGSPWEVAAATFASVHPYALDYIIQCPALIVAMTGSGLRDQKNRWSFVRNSRPLFDSRLRLAEVCKRFGLSPVLRRLCIEALQGQCWQALMKLSTLKPSFLSQILPYPGSGAQLTFMEQVDMLVFHGMLGKEFEWCMRYHADLTPEVVDYLRMQERTEREKIVRRSYERVAEDARRWHEQEVLQALTGGESSFSYDKRTVPPLHYPEVWDAHEHRNYFGAGGVETQGWTIHMLRTRQDFELESIAMRHCVRTYFDIACMGRCQIFSVHHEGSRVATLEVRNGVRGQLKGRSNHIFRDESVVASIVNTFLNHMSSTQWQNTLNSDRS